jgi:photosystem II stability/assembly factor-like uncharacterized protein
MATLYAAMRDALVVATDDGDGWQADRRLDGHDLECVAASPAAPERAFLGTFEDGLLRTTDGGDSFERVGDAVESDAVMSATVSPHDPAEVWVGTEPSAVYRSSDGGDSFEQVGDVTALPSAAEWYFPPRPDTHHVRWIELDPNDPERVYVGIEAGALLRSDDGGATWQERPPGSRRDNHTLATHPDAPGRVCSAAGDGYAESTDGGESWCHPQEGLQHRYVWGLAVAPGDPDTVLVSAATGARNAHSQPAESYCYRKRDGAWERLDDRGLPTGEGVIRAVLAAGHEPGELFAVTNRGAYRTTDAGDAWTRLPFEWADRFEDRTCRGLAVV